MKRREFIAALGGAVVWPLAARAQQRTLPVIGVLGSPTADGYAPLMAEFWQGLKEAGFIEGQNLAVEQRWANNQYDRLPQIADDLVRARVSLIMAIGNNLPARVANAATSKIPIVFIMGADPVTLGLVASLNHPGGNITGVTYAIVEVLQKRCSCSTTWFQTPDVLGTSSTQTICPVLQPSIRRGTQYATGAVPLKSRMPGCA